MGWSTRIVVAKNYGGEFLWDDFNRSLELIEWNKTYLAQYMGEVINNFPNQTGELRYETEGGDGWHYCGWYYWELTKDVLAELSKPDSIERFADVYDEYSWGFKNKKERKEFIKEWKDTLRVCKFLVNKSYVKLYWVEG